MAATIQPTAPAARASSSNGHAAQERHATSLTGADGLATVQGGAAGPGASACRCHGEHDELDRHAEGWASSEATFTGRPPVGGRAVGEGRSSVGRSVCGTGFGAMGPP
jgi:hypothetical protein